MSEEATDTDYEIVEKAANSCVPEGHFVGDAILIFSSQNPADPDAKYNYIPNHKMPYHHMMGLLETIEENLARDAEEE